MFSSAIFRFQFMLWLSAKWLQKSQPLRLDKQCSGEARSDFSLWFLLGNKNNLCRSLSGDATSCLIGHVQVTCQFLSQSLVRDPYANQVHLEGWVLSPSPQNIGAAWRRDGHLNKVRIVLWRKKRQEMLRRKSTMTTPEVCIKGHCYLQDICLYQSRRSCHFHTSMTEINNLAQVGSCLGSLSILLSIF